MASSRCGGLLVPVPLSSSTVPWGTKSSAFCVLPSRSPLTSIVLPGAVVRMPEPLTDKPPRMFSVAPV